MHPSRAVILVALATAFSLLGDQTLYAVLPTHFTRLGLLPYQVGLILSVNRWVRLLTNHLAERLCARFSPALLLCLALALGAGTTTAYGLLPVFPALLVARILWGLCWSFIRHVGLMTAVRGTTGGDLGRRIGLYNGISRMGALAGNFVGGLGHDLIGFTMTLTVFGALSLIGVPLGALSQRGLSFREKSPSDGEPGAQRDLGLWVCGFVVGCVAGGMVMSTLGLALEKTVGSSASFAGMAIGVATLNGLLLAGRWVAEALSAPALGSLTDRIGRRSAAILFFGAGAAALLAAGVTSGTILLAFLVLFFFICGVGTGVVTVAEAGTRGSRSLASYVTSADMGSAAGPMLGWMTQQIGLPIAWIFLIGGGLYALACAASMGTFREGRAALGR